MDILIEEYDGSLWAAGLQDGRLSGLEVDPAYEEVRWGSIYWAKVKTIDAALDAVFVDLDGENTGILYNKDVRIKQKNGSFKKGGEKAIGKVLQPGDMICVQAKMAFMSADSYDYMTQESKLPQVSMDITLPGRYLIFCPMMAENRISVRVRDKNLRKNMQSMLDELGDIQGCILRAAAADMQTDVLMREGKILREAWSQMQQYLEGQEAALIMLGPDAVQRILSDNAFYTIDRIEVVVMDHLNLVEEWCSVFAPDLVTKIEPVEIDGATQDLALYHYRDIIGQIEDLFHPYAILPNGGNIILQETAALTAVDVNKGGDKRSHLAVNIDAAKEVCRQMRLRNTGGIIVVDFLKTNNKKDEDKLLEVLEAEIQKDPCTVQIHGKTALGLYELTRKRRTPPLQDRFEGDLD